MSLIVQYNLERSVEELQAYKKYLIFTDEEISQIIEKRKHFEYQLQRSEKILLDFLYYIEYEKKLEKIIKKRNKIKGFSYTTKKIIYLYKKTIRIFNDDRTIKMFVDYLMKKRKYHILKEFFSEYCTLYPKNTDFFIFAAGKCLEFDDYEAAKILFVKGIRYNKEAKQLYLELFRLETFYYLKSLKMNEKLGIEENDAEDVKNCEMAVAIAKEFISHFGCDVDVSALMNIAKIDDHLSQQINLLLNK